MDVQPGGDLALKRYYVIDVSIETRNPADLRSAIDHADGFVIGPSWQLSATSGPTARCSRSYFVGIVAFPFAILELQLLTVIFSVPTLALVGGFAMQFLVGEVQHPRLFQIRIAPCALLSDDFFRIGGSPSPDFLCRTSNASPSANVPITQVPTWARETTEISAQPTCFCLANRESHHHVPIES